MVLCRQPQPPSRRRADLDAAVRDGCSGGWIAFERLKLADLTLLVHPRERRRQVRLSDIYHSRSGGAADVGSNSKSLADFEHASAFIQRSHFRRFDGNDVGGAALTNLQRR